MSSPDSSLLALVERIRAKAPEYVDLMAAESEADFDKAFDAILERSLHHLETNGKNLASLDENGLTAVLAGALSVPGLSVSQEANSNGHVDITISANYCSPMRKKLGEAKVYGGPEYHLKGLNQLLARYSTGHECRGLVIAYVKQQNIKGLIEKVRDKMDADLPEHQQGKTMDHPCKWHFLSRHLHSSGEVLEVGHAGCNLHIDGHGA
ncbi:hypothetical protein GCM10007164_02420 [Luteimonas padinae]|uniref:Uncharacterized protein n=1 Tax=Luteimonas padinae TaxID=1714359 RepID=A0ABV6SXI6_9GAMM|nr:hypothetical protein [Luteimonas padinae]GHD65304.1 hypothetical protein GCM10007164_02420 [Luteimonas padinae]